MMIKEKWVRGVIFAAALAVGFGAAKLAGAEPRDNPAARYNLEWTDAIRWSSVVSIEDFEGGSLTERLYKAQAAIAARGGGIFFLHVDTGFERRNGTNAGGCANVWLR